MTLDINRSDLTGGVVGTGAMGRGIAQIAAQAGVKVFLYDTRADAAPAGTEVDRAMATPSSSALNNSSAPKAISRNRRRNQRNIRIG